MAIAWWDEQVVTIGESFYSLQSNAQQLATVVHKDLHLYFRNTHPFIARKLELGEYGNDEDAASEAITQWLEGGCE